MFQYGLLLSRALNLQKEKSYKMPGFSQLYTQDFTLEDTIIVPHGLDRLQTACRVLVNGEARNDIIQSIVPSDSDPRNELTVSLTEVASGVVQILDSNYVFSNIPTPEDTSALATNVSGSSFSGSFSGSFTGDGSELSGISAEWNGILVGNAQITGTLGVTSDITSSGTYNGVFHYESSAADPTSPTPSDGDRYYNTSLEMEMRYDGTRSKWLSVEVCEFNFGRKGDTAAGSFYKGINSLAYTTTRGRNLEFNGTIVSMTYTRSDTDLTSLEAVVGGSTIASISTAAVAGTDSTLNADFSQGDVMAARNLSGGNKTSNVNGTIRFKWRAT